MSSSVPVATDQKVGGSSPSERATSSQARVHFIQREKPYQLLPRGRASHNLSQLLNNLVDAGQRLAALFQVIGARVDAGPLGESGWRCGAGCGDAAHH